MPAQIIVEAGARPGEYPIEQEVVLLGKDGSCAARPAELAAVGHAATLEYRQGRYTVYNRLPQAMQLGTQALAVRGSREWRAGERLYLSDAVVLRLEVEGDPAPARAAPKVVVVPDLPEDAEAKPDKKGGSKVWQYAVIAGCVVLLIASFLANRDDSPEKKSPGVDFDKLVQELREQEGDVGPDAVWSLLKEARAQEQRGLRGEANGMYRRVTIILRQRHGDGLPTASDAEKRADAFARGRLSGGE
jgi:hypothetical protein